MTNASENLPDLIHTLVESFEEIHGRTPTDQEAQQIGLEAFLMLTVDEVFEIQRQMLIGDVDWIEA